VEAYCSTAKGNATQAAKQAGYKGNDNALSTASHQLLRNPKIHKAVTELMNKASAESGLCRAEIIHHIADIIRDADNNTRDRLKAMELWCKMSGAFIERREVKHINPGPTISVQLDEAEGLARSHRNAKKHAVHIIEATPKASKGVVS